MIPRNSYSATSITTASDVLRDPALAAMQRIDADTRSTETSDAALARIVKALGQLMPAWHRDPTRGCAGMDPATFISKQPKARAASFAACGRCPADIRRECLAYAIDTADTVAIMGGHDGPARRPLIRERQTQLEEQRRAAEAEHDEPDNDEEIT